MGHKACLRLAQACICKSKWTCRCRCRCRCRCPFVSGEWQRVLHRLGFAVATYPDASPCPQDRYPAPQVCIWRVADLLPRPGAPAAAAPPMALAAYPAGSGPASAAVPLRTLAHPEAVFGCAFAPGGTDADVQTNSSGDAPQGVLAAACKDATVRFWDIGSGEQVRWAAFLSAASRVILAVLAHQLRRRYRGPIT